MRWKPPSITILKPNPSAPVRAGAFLIVTPRSATVSGGSHTPRPSAFRPSLIPVRRFLWRNYKEVILDLNHNEVICRLS